jgi:hypothetical protein
VLPLFLVEEITVRESGESAVFDVSEYCNQNLLLTFGITHAVEHESIGVEIHTSPDGSAWMPRPTVSFAPKSYCGTYQLILPLRETPYLKISWNVRRWSQSGHGPFFRFYIFARPARAGMAVAGAA